MMANCWTFPRILAIRRWYECKRRPVFCQFSLHLHFWKFAKMVKIQSSETAMKMIHRKHRSRNTKIFFDQKCSPNMYFCRICIVLTRNIWCFQTNSPVWLWLFEETSATRLDFFFDVPICAKLCCKDRYKNFYTCAKLCCKDRYENVPTCAKFCYKTH